MRLIIAVLLFGTALFADNLPSNEGKLTHESGAGIVIASGNSDTQTYNLQQKTAYAWTGNTFTLTGSYLLGKTAGVDTAKKWDLGLRYERSLIENLSAFLGYQLDSNPFAGTNLRHTVDLGAKYAVYKTENTEINAEAGYHLTVETFTLDDGNTSEGQVTSHMSRVFGEVKHNWNKSVSFRFWIEYLQDFTNTKDYRFNFEPSVSVLLNDVFSLKMAYLLNYRSVPAVAGKKTTDGLYTTSLVAKF